MRYDGGMRRAIFVPSAISLISAALAFGLLIATAMAVAKLAPHLGELLRTSPRLAMLALFGIFVAPALVVAIGHHLAHRAMDGVDSSTRTRRSFLPSVESWWAGAHAWLVIGGASVLSRLVMLVLNPPKVEPDTALGMLASEASQVGTLANAASLYPILWILVAAQLFELERRARSHAKDA
jgi:hypothetical protein